MHATEGCIKSDRSSAESIALMVEGAHTVDWVCSKNNFAGCILNQIILRRGIS
jgi:hypothetical protein